MVLIAILGYDGSLIMKTTPSVAHFKLQFGTDLIDLPTRGDNTEHKNIRVMTRSTRSLLSLTKPNVWAGILFLLGFEVTDKEKKVNVYDDVILTYYESQYFVEEESRDGIAMMDVPIDIINTLVMYMSCMERKDYSPLFED